MTHPHDQSAYQVRLEWGPDGAALLGPSATVAVVCDVLSFSTTTTVAIERGATVLPYRWNDDSAAAFATEHDAVLAVGRSRRGPGRVSLSPASFLSGGVPARVVLPSPNGATVSALLAESGANVLLASLRNRLAVASHLADVLDDGGSVALVPAGERWPGDALRPAVEDLWGVGGVAAALDEAGHELSPEATAAAAAYRAVAGDLLAALRSCASGRELVEAGFGDEVDIAGEADVSTVVPLLVDGAFGPA